MATRWSIGFAQKKDLSDFYGIYVHYDGVPDHVVVSLAWAIKFGRFSEVVKYIRSGKPASSLEDWEGLLAGKPVFESLGEDSQPMVGNDLFREDYGYVLSKDKIEVYQGSDRAPKIYRFDKIDWQKVYQGLFGILFGDEKNVRLKKHYAFDGPLKSEIGV